MGNNKHDCEFVSNKKNIIFNMYYRCFVQNVSYDRTHDSQRFRLKVVGVTIQTTGSYDTLVAPFFFSVTVIATVLHLLSSVKI